MVCMQTYHSGRSTRFFIGRVYAAEDGFDDVGFKNIVDAMDVEMAGIARIRPCMGIKTCPPAKEQAAKLATKMADSCFNLTGVFLDVVQPELWPPNQKENDAFIWDFLKTLRDNTPSRWFIGIYTNKSSFSSIVGPYWVRRKNVDLRLWLPEHQDTSQFEPFGSWKKADFFQQEVSLKRCGIVFNSDTGDLVRPEPTPMDTGIPWWCFLVASTLILAVITVASVLLLLRRKRQSSRYERLRDDLICNISTLIDEIVALKEAFIGATMVFPALPSAFDIQFYNNIARHQRVESRPLKKGDLLRLFVERRKGHDGAAVIDLFGYADPWIRSSRHQLPYDPSAPTIVANRGSRHNSAAYASSLTKALIVVVSNEAGTVSVFQNGDRYMNLSTEELLAKMDSFLRDRGAEEAQIAE
ncbi:Protein LYS-4 [Aphelenchoides avenae]|nr:Protein LYS-4 [Aphelenchus avenae]